MKFTDHQINDKLKAYMGWELEKDVITKTYSFQSFMMAIDFVNKVAVIAEHYNHHPDIFIHYTKVKFGLSTHEEGGITDKDFDMVRELEQLAATTI